MIATMDPAAAKRLAHVQTAVLIDGGSHAKNDAKMCVMEAIAYVAGEPWSHHPECVHPILTSWAIMINDLGSREDRAELVPYITRMIGTSDIPGAGETLTWCLFDWAIRDITSATMERLGFPELAKRLSNLGPITDNKSEQAALLALVPVLDSAITRSYPNYYLVRAREYILDWDTHSHAIAFVSSLVRLHEEVGFRFVALDRMLAAIGR